MKTIESWVQDMKSQGAGFANALVVNLILAFITGTAILGFFLCAAKAYSSYMRIADSLQADTTQTKNYRTTTRTRYERLRQAEKHQDQRTEEMYY